MSYRNRNRYGYHPGGNRRNLAASSKRSRGTVSARREGYAARIAPKSVSQARADIATWNAARRAAQNVNNPSRAKLQRLYKNILVDAHLTAQINLRTEYVQSIPGILMRGAEVAEEETELIASASWARELDRRILETTFYGTSLVELTPDREGGVRVDLLPRENVVPERGLLLLSEDDTEGIPYREVREYGTWVLEFGTPGDFGLLDKAVPHVLFARFAQSCWSELCEIYGIPPRVLKTNTQDPAMLGRGEAMMRDMGAAAWFIIDETESFEFARGADTNGDIYRNLISVCKEATSELIVGAVLGQDTLNGNRSKEESGLKLLSKIVEADKARRAACWNDIVLPALARIGLLPPGLTFQNQPEEDLEILWTQTHQAMQYYHVSAEWIKTKFGIEVTGERESAAGGTGSALGLHAADRFFG